MNNKLQKHIDTQIDKLIANLPDTEANISIGKLRNMLDLHLTRNFMPAYSGYEIQLLDLAFINYWVSNITIQNLYDRVYAICQDDTDRVIDPVFLNNCDI